MSIRLPPNLRGREMRSEISSLVLLNERANLLKILKDRDNSINRRKELQQEHEDIVKRLSANIKQKKTARAKGRGGIRKSRAQEKRETERMVRGERRTPGTDEPSIIGETVRKTDGGLTITYTDPAELARARADRAADVARLDAIRVEDNRLRGEREAREENLRRDEIRFNRERLERDERRHRELLEFRDREMRQQFDIAQAQAQLAQVAAGQAPPPVVGVPPPFIPPAPPPPDFFAEAEEQPLAPTQSALELARQTSQKLLRAGELLDPSPVAPAPPEVEREPAPLPRAPSASTGPIAESVAGDPALTAEIETPAAPEAEASPEDLRREFIEEGLAGGGSVFGEAPAAEEDALDALERELSVEIPDQRPDQLASFLEAQKSSADKPPTVAELFRENPISEGEVEAFRRESPRQPATGRDYEADLKILSKVYSVGDPGTQERKKFEDELAKGTYRSMLTNLQEIENSPNIDDPNVEFEKLKKQIAEMDSLNELADENIERLMRQKEQEREEEILSGNRLVDIRKRFTPPAPLPFQPGLDAALAERLALSGKETRGFRDEEGDLIRTTGLQRPTLDLGEPFDIQAVGGSGTIVGREPPPPRPRAKLPDILEEGLPTTTSRLDPTRSSKLATTGRRGGLSPDAELEEALSSTSLAASASADEPAPEEPAPEEEPAKKKSRRDKIPELLESLENLDRDRQINKKLLKAMRDFQKSNVVEGALGPGGEPLQDYLEDQDEGIDTNFDKVIEVILKGHKNTWDDKKRFNSFFDRIDKIVSDVGLGVVGTTSSGQSSEDFDIEAYDAGDDELIALFPQFNKEDAETALEAVKRNGYEPFFVDPNQFGIMDTVDEIPYVIKYNEDGKAEIWNTNMKPEEDYVDPLRFRKIGIVEEQPDDREMLMIVDDNGKRILSLAGPVVSPSSSESDTDSDFTQPSPKKIRVNGVEYFIDETTDPKVLIDINTGERLFELIDQPDLGPPAGPGFSLKPIPKEPEEEDPFDALERELTAPPPPPAPEPEPAPALAPAPEPKPVIKSTKPIPATIGTKGGVQRSTSGSSKIGPRADGTKGGYTDNNIITLLELRDDIKVSKSKKKEMKDVIKRLRQQDSNQPVNDAIDEIRKLL